MLGSVNHSTYLPNIFEIKIQNERVSNVLPVARSKPNGLRTEPPRKVVYSRLGW